MCKRVLQDETCIATTRRRKKNLWEADTIDSTRVTEQMNLDDNQRGEAKIDKTF